MLVAVLAATVDVRGAIGFSSFAVLVYYAIANASAWTLGARVIPAVGLIGCVVLAFALPSTSVIAGVGVVILGAALYPWLKGVPALQRYIAALVLSDANFARSLEASERGERDVAYLFAGGILLWLTWTVSTHSGAPLGRP